MCFPNKIFSFKKQILWLYGIYCGSEVGFQKILQFRFLFNFLDRFNSCELWSLRIFLFYKNLSRRFFQYQSFWKTRRWIFLLEIKKSIYFKSFCFFSASSTTKMEWFAYFGSGINRTFEFWGMIKGFLKEWYVLEWIGAKGVNCKISRGG